MAVARQYPDINLGPGYTYDKGDSVITLSLGLTLPVLHNERAQIDQAVALRERAARQFESVQQQAVADIDTALAQYRAEYAAWIEARDADSAIAQTAESAQRRLTFGAADQGELLTARIAEVTGKRATLDALRGAISALDALEDSIQRPVWPKSQIEVDDEGSHVAQ
jgi:outer membrane protein TolC